LRRPAALQAGRRPRASALHRHRARHGLPSGARDVSRLAARLTLSALAVALVAIGTITVGVLVVGASVFQDLMTVQGESTASVESMWQQSVVTVIAVAAAIAAVLSVGLGVLLAWRLSQPLRRLGSAARRVARGDYGARVAREGPRELVSVA